MAGACWSCVTSMPSTLRQPQSMVGTTADVHFGRAEQRRAERINVLEAAHRAHPERFVLGTPIPPPLPTAAWINQPKSVDGSVTTRA